MVDIPFPKKDVGTAGMQLPEKDNTRKPEFNNPSSLAGKIPHVEDHTPREAPKPGVTQTIPPKEPQPREWTPTAPLANKENTPETNKHDDHADGNRNATELVSSSKGSPQAPNAPWIKPEELPTKAEAKVEKERQMTENQTIVPSGLHVSQRAINPRDPLPMPEASKAEGTVVKLPEPEDAKPRIPLDQTKAGRKVKQELNPDRARILKEHGGLEGNIPMNSPYWNR